MLFFFVMFSVDYKLSNFPRKMVVWTYDQVLLCLISVMYNLVIKDLTFFMYMGIRARGFSKTEVPVVVSLWHVFCIVRGFG